MPRDKRLFMTFPIDFWQHPKIEPLSVDAKWAFVEMNGYSRMQDLDGRIPARTAAKKWSAEVLAELMDSHPERPVLVKDGDAFVLRDYAEHQETRESIAKRKETNSVNGAKGGRPPKDNPRETESVSGAEATEKQSQRSEIEIRDSDTQLPSPESLELNAREFTTKELADSRSVIEQFGITGFDDLALNTLLVFLLEAADRPVTSVGAYVRRCTQRSPVKVRNLAVEAERQAARVRAVVGA